MRNSSFYDLASGGSNAAPSLVSVRPGRAIPRGERRFCIDCGSPKNPRGGERCKSCAARFYKFQERMAGTQKSGPRIGARKILLKQPRGQQRIEYRNWRRAVLDRDNHTCTECGSRPVGRRLHAHHIKPFETHPALAYEVSNGRTLCATCHAKIESRLHYVGSALQSMNVERSRSKARNTPTEAKTK